VVNGGGGQQAGDGNLAAGDVDVQLVADPGLLVALAVCLGADVAGGGQFGEHLVDGLRGLPLEPRRLGLRPGLVRARASALARRLSGGGRRRIVLPVVGLFRRGVSRASISVASRAITPPMRPPSARSISAAGILSGRSPCANSAKARENVASEGTCARRSQPRMRRSDLSTASRSIKAEVVEMPSIALATKALARARRSSGGRPGPHGGSGTKASRPITSRVVTRRPSASVIGSTSSRSQGNRVPWIWFQRAFMASRGSSDMPVTTNRDDKPKQYRKYPQCTAIYIIL